MTQSTALAYLTSDKEIAYCHDSFINGSFPVPGPLVTRCAALRHLGHDVLVLSLLDLYLVRYKFDQPSTALLLARTVPKTIAAVAIELQVCERAKFSAGEKRSQLLRNQEVVNGIAESVLAARMLTDGYESIRELIHRHSLDESTALLQARADPKTELQEYCAKVDHSAPIYEVVRQSGPDHRASFIVRVSALEKTSVGKGSTKKSASVAAASALLTHLTSREHESQPQIEHSCWTPSPLALERVQPVLKLPVFKGVRSELLALALTFSSPQGTHYGFNGPLKALGDSLVRVLFANFIYREIPFEDLHSKTITILYQGILKDTLYSQGYDVLGLSRFATRRQDDIHPISDLRKMEMIKALVAALYLSLPNFDLFRQQMESLLGSVVRTKISDFTSGNHTVAGNPKSALQELLQMLPGLTPIYNGTIHGPQHKAQMKVRLLVRATDDLGGNLLTTGQGTTMGEAERDAATLALKAFLPSDQAHVGVFPVWFWTKVIRATTEDSSFRLRGACGIDALRAMDCVAALIDMKRFTVSFPSILRLPDIPKVAAAIGRAVADTPFYDTSRTIDLISVGVRLVTSISPEATSEFISGPLPLWLDDLRASIASIKLPSTPISASAEEVDLMQVGHAHLRRLKVQLQTDGYKIAEPAFSHALNILEVMDEMLGDGRDVCLVAENTETGGTLRLVFAHETELERLALRVERQSRASAFFSGCRDAVQSGNGRVSYKITYVRSSSASLYGDLFLQVMAHLYAGQQFVAALHRIVHDIKNQVVAIQNFATNRGGQGKRFQAYAQIEAIQQELRKRQTAIENFRRLSEGAGKATCDPRAVLRSLFARELNSFPAGIDLKVNESGLGDRMPFAAELLDSLLTNLVRNAVEAMPKGGKLSIDMSATTDSLFIEVLDTGIGMSAEKTRMLWSGRSSKKNGMGLGLATVRRIVDMYGGVIDVKSRLGNGAIFIIILPIGGNGGRNASVDR